MNKFKRRAFLKSSRLGALALSAGQQRVRAADTGKKLVVGLIGTGGMGTTHLKTMVQHKDIKVAYVCDLDKNRLAAAAGSVAFIVGNTPTPVDELRRVRICTYVETHDFN